MNENKNESKFMSKVSPKLTASIGNNRSNQGFAKVVAGGRIIRLRKDAPFYERLVTGEQTVTSTSDAIHSKAVLDSVTANLEAGINMVDKQETCLAKIGGRLSDIAMALNHVRDPESSVEEKTEAQKNFESARDKIRKIAVETYDNTALFSNGPAKPVTIAVPSRKKWEGLSVDRANLSQPGLITVDKGKVFGDAEGYTLEPGSIKRAFEEWRSLCISNRMQHSLLSNRLHAIKQKVRDLMSGDSWEAPSEPVNQNGPLSRPHLNN